MNMLEMIDGSLTIKIPEELQSMTEEMRERCYPYEERPELIWSDADGQVQMTFQSIEKKLTAQETGQAAESMREYTESVYPNDEILPVHLYLDGEIPVGWFVIKMNMGTEEKRHVKSVFSVCKKMCILTLTYPEQEHLKWEVIIKNVFAKLQERGIG